MKRRLFSSGRDAESAEGLGREVDDELRFHLESKTEALIAAGMSREEAEKEAYRRFGDVGSVRRDTASQARRTRRHRRAGAWLDGVRQDGGYAVRQLRSHPVFSLVVVLTLALGIGANTAVFSVVDGIMFRPLPFPEPDELVVVWTDVTERGGPDDEWLSWSNARDIRDQASSLTALAAWGGWGPSWTDPAEPTPVAGAFVSRDMFTGVLRTAAVEGRTLQSEDHLPGASPRLVLAWDFWQRALGGDPAVVGTSLTLSGTAWEVVGVMPENFLPPFLPDVDFWGAYVPPDGIDERRGGFGWRTVGRLADGVGMERAAQEMDAISGRLRESYPESNTGMSFRAVPLRNDMVAEARPGLLALFGAVLVVLIAAVVNVANLLLVRASRRTTEMSVRSALGAGRGRIVRQLLTESLMLALLGGLTGLAVAYAGTDLLVSLAPEGTPRLQEIGVSGRVLLFSAVVTVGAGLLFGTIPALRVVAGDLQGGLREGSRAGVARGGGGLRSGLVVSQVSLAMVVLVGAALLVQSFRNLGTADLGFDPTDLITMRFSLPGPAYPDGESVQSFVFPLEDRLRNLSGAEGAVIAATVPLAGFDGDVSFEVEGRPPAAPGEGLATWYRPVSHGYLDLLGIELQEGRGLQETDDGDSPPVIVINRTLADRVFPGEDPIGRRINYHDPADPNWREIVGIAEDVRQFGIREPARPAIYVPVRQSASRSYTAVVKTDRPMAEVAGWIRGAVAELDGSIAVGDPRSLQQMVAAEMAPDRFVTSLVGLFAGIALVLTLVGLYGVVAFTVGARIRELGLRIALGAQPVGITRMILGRSLALVGVGLVLGVLAALGTARILESILFGVEPGDPMTIVAVSALMFMAATLAASVPAIRAARVDPAEALRTE